MSQRSDREAAGLKPEAADDQSIASSPTIISSPLSAFHNHPGYQRLKSTQEEDTSYRGYHPSISELPEDDSVHGLRIRFSDHDEGALKFGATVDHTPNTQHGAGDDLLSPSSAHSLKHGRSASTGSSPYDDGYSYGRSSPSSMSRLDGPFSGDPEEELLKVKRSASTLKSFDTSALQDGEPRCKTRRHFHHSRGTWLSVTVIVLSIYSTIFSGIWLGIAIARPRYGRYITDNGHLPPATASLLCAAFAKTIELSFVTVFVTFLGQVLSQRAFVKKSRGVTISEMQMRSWVMQPGTMITHWETVRYGALTLLGAAALIAAVIAMLYTTASDGLVAPKLKFGPLQYRKIYGAVKTKYGYETYIQGNCKTPIDNATDPDHFGETCMAIEYSGQGYHNYAQWLTKWSETITLRNGTLDQADRPNPVGIMFDNTTIEGSWIESPNMTTTSREHKRIINNVTMAMPHSGVVAAASDAINDILQPQDLDGLGEYYLEASVPSPALNVLCAALTTEELSPMVLTQWPGYNDTAPNTQNYPGGYDIPLYPSWLNKTAVDDVFGFGEKYGRRMPVFPKLPATYNTVINVTQVLSGSETDSMYVLGANNNSNYMLCSLRTYLSPNCSTVYHASLSGGRLSSTCNDPDNRLAYGRSYPEATSGVYLSDWVNVANQWAQTMSLGAGITDNYASNPRLLTQLIPTDEVLSPLLPSTAEALAVLAGCTLLFSSLDAPFLHYWNSTPSLRVLDPPQYQAFNATLRSQDYSSGGTQHWQGIFYIVLILIFATNLFCLAYFAAHKGLVTDFIEPQNLFALAVNSPQSYVLEGSCGGGPEHEQLKSNWHIKLDTARDHFFIESMDEPVEVQQVRRRKRGRIYSGSSGPRQWGRQILLGRKRTGPNTFNDYNHGHGNAYTDAGGGSAGQQMEVETSPVADLFNKLSHKRSSLL